MTAKDTIFPVLFVLSAWAGAGMAVAAETWEPDLVNILLLSISEMFLVLMSLDRSNKGRKDIFKTANYKYEVDTPVYSELYLFYN
jgi:hypothetical protein